MSPHVFDRWCGELRVGDVSDADVTSYMQTSSSLRSTTETLHAHKFGTEWIAVEYVVIYGSRSKLNDSGGFLTLPRSVLSPSLILPPLSTQGAGRVAQSLAMW